MFDTIILLCYNLNMRKNNLAIPLEGRDEEGRQPALTLIKGAREKTESNLLKDKIAQIEKMDLGLRQLAEAILVLLGKKPTTELIIYEWNQDPAEVKRILENAGLVVKEKVGKQPRDTRVVSVFAVALNKALAEQLVHAEANKDHEAYGRLMGFPETAIRAFLNKGDLLPKGEYPDNDNFFTSGFKFSKTHAREEFKVLEGWGEAIKTYAPQLYSQLNKDHQAARSEGKLERIKDEIMAGQLEGMSWQEIRHKYGIIFNKIGDPHLILSIVGSTALTRYFKALGGEGKPYRFALPISTGDLGTYLTYETSKQPAQLIFDSIKEPLTPASINILISHCIHIPRFTLPLLEEITEELLPAFIMNIGKNYPEAYPYLVKIFENKRLAFLKALGKYNSKNSPPAKLIDAFRGHEYSLFGKSAR